VQNIVPIPSGRNNSLEKRSVEYSAKLSSSRVVTLKTCIKPRILRFRLVDFGKAPSRIIFGGSAADDESLVPLTTESKPTLNIM
jgi:hypothetical protein